MSKAQASLNKNSVHSKGYGQREESDFQKDEDKFDQSK